MFLVVLFDEAPFIGAVCCLTYKAVGKVSRMAATNRSMQFKQQNSTLSWWILEKANDLYAN